MRAIPAIACTTITLHDEQRQPATTAAESAYQAGHFIYFLTPIS